MKWLPIHRNWHVIGYDAFSDAGFKYSIRETYDGDFEIKITHLTNYAIAEQHTGISSLEEAKGIAEEHAENNN